MLKLITIEVGQCMPSLVDGKLILTFFMQIVKKKNVSVPGREWKYWCVG